MTERRKFRGVIGSWSLAAAMVFATAISVRAPTVASAAGAAPRESIEHAANRNATCVSCHESEAKTWSGSQHHNAASDASFKTAIDIEPLAFCRGCHAPSADPEKPTPAAAEALGIGCVHCHDGSAQAPSALAAFGARIAGDKRPPAHAKLKTKACASCHEFAFPDPPSRLMQSTVTEHAQSAYAETSCAACHMRRDASGHVDHGFVVSSNPEMLRNAASVRVTRAGASRIAIRITPAAVGHAFPTGDLFRRLRASVSVVGEGGKTVLERHRYLARHFGVVRSPNGTLVRAEVRDDRPGGRDAEACFELALGRESKGKTWAFNLAYQRVDHPRSESDLDAAAVSQNTVLFAQELSPSLPEEPCSK